jgi:hypothetical protein
MSRRPASITQADIARALRAAKQVGAKQVEVRVGNAIIIIRISDSSTGGTENSLEKIAEIVL